MPVLEEILKKPDQEWVKGEIRRSLEQSEKTLSDADKEWLSGELNQHAERVKESLRPKGWQKFTHALRDWGAVGAAITGAIALLGIAITAVFFAVSEIGKNSEFRGTTVEHLKTIDRDFLEI